MGENRRVLVALLALFSVVVPAGCASTPAKPDVQGVVFAKPTEMVQKAAVDALAVTGFDVAKADPLYVEGSRPRKVGLFVGSGGETVGIWLDTLGPSSTRVRVDTAKSILGLLGQKNWDDEILVEMEKSLGGRP